MLYSHLGQRASDLLLFRDTSAVERALSRAHSAFDAEQQVVEQNVKPQHNRAHNDQADQRSAYFIGVTHRSQMHLEVAQTGLNPMVALVEMNLC